VCGDRAAAGTRRPRQRALDQFAFSINQVGGTTIDGAINYPPIQPIPDLSAWAQTLERIAAGPLEFCQDLATVARRFEAWWAQDLLDRPVFIATANADPSRPITRRLDLLDQPDAWFEAKFADMLQTHRVGDALPNIRVDFGPVLLGGLFGGELEFGADTTWTHAFIDDGWSNAPDWTIRDDNHWWMLLRKLTKLVAEDAAGRYLVCTPNLGGAGDVLLNLRGSAQLCMDVMDQPHRVCEALDGIYAGWHHAFTELYRIVLGQGAGLVHWHRLWSNRPWVIPECDFNALIGPNQFTTLFLPDIARHAATVGRAVFHLDGPDAARHVDALLDVPDIQAIQFTPGAGTPSALAWVDMFVKIQQRTRSVLVICPAEEVLALCEALRPEGLAIWVDAPLTPDELDDLFARFCKLY
jgi:hypothetical protein